MHTHDDAPTDTQPTENLTDWANPPSLRSIKQDYTDAKIESDNQVARVDGWLDNLNITGSARLPHKKNRSSIQPKLIRKQAEWRYASLSEPFLSTPDVFNVSPVTFEDRQGAQQNQLVLNHQFNNQIDKVNFIDTYVRTGVDEGTIIVRLGWEYEEEEITKEVPAFMESQETSPAFAAQLQQLAQLQQSAPEDFAQLPEEQQRSLARSMETQTPVRVFQQGTEEVTETVVKRNQPTAEVCDYRDVVIDPSAKGKMEKARFVVYKFTTSLEELRSSGLYSNLDNIKVSNSSPLADADGYDRDNTNFNFQDEPRKQFIAYEYWGYWDINGDGTVEPIVATWAGDTLIRMEKNPFPDKKIPFVTVPYLPVRNSLYGEPDGELIKDNQDVVGAVTRGMIDILGNTANGQRGTQKGALDAINRRKFEQGKDYEYNSNAHPDKSFYTHSFAEIPNSAQFMYQQQSMEAESMIGVKAFGADGLSGSALGDTATGIRGALDAASKRELGILRRLANGIIEIGRRFISMNSEFLSDEEIIRVTNEEFVKIKRENLAGDFDLRLSISTAEEDNAKAQELAFMLQTTAQSSDPAEVRMIRAEIARLRKMPELAKRIEEYQPQPDPLQQQKMMLEIKLLEAQIAETQMHAQERGSDVMLNQAKAEETSSKADKNNLDFVEQESGVKQERELQKQGEQARANASLEVVKQSLANNQTK